MAWRRTLVVTLAALCTLPLGVRLPAASAYANPAFQTQWQAGEALAQNFWGPLANAKDGQQEPYKEAQGGTRLVQYFDKGRMELTNGAVTNGLLASELVKGQVQTGDSAFENRPSPAIPVAGDPGGGAPTYGDVGGQFKELLGATPSQVGNYVRYGIVSGNRLTFESQTGPNTDPTKVPLGLRDQLTVYDAATQHNVYTTFAAYRDRVALATIGLAISEPFFAQVAVAGQQHWILIQVFERRLLTYTPDNPAAFQVEMGNVGQHYYQWRYPSGAPSTTTGTGPVTDQLATWTDPGGRLQFRYPSAWPVRANPTSNNPDNTIVILDGPLDSEGVSVAVAAQSGSAMEEASDIANNLQGNALATYTIHNDGKNLTIGGEPAYTFTATGMPKSDPKAVFERQVWVVNHNGGMFMVNATYTGSLPPEIGAIIASVVFLK